VLCDQPKTSACEEDHLHLSSDALASDESMSGTDEMELARERPGQAVV
jgi:hypothetical protein